MAWMPGHKRPMKSGTARRSVSPSVRLGFESLEPRVLLATAEFMVHLYRDDQGAPGARITDDTVEVGESFFVEITAREFDPDFAGLAGVSLDIAWDPATLREIDARFDPSDPESRLVTPDFPLYRQGRLDNDAGTIDELAGIASKLLGAGRAIGDFQPERFSLLHFQAIQPAESSSFTMEQGRLRIVTAPVSNLRPTQVYFEPQTITVKPGVTASAVADNPTAPEEKTATTLPSPVEPNLPPLETSAARPVPDPPFPALFVSVGSPSAPPDTVCHPDPFTNGDAEGEAESSSELVPTLADDADEAPVAVIESVFSRMNATTLPTIDSLPDRRAAMPSVQDEDRGFKPTPWLFAATSSVASAAQRDRLGGMVSTSAAAYAANLDELLGSDGFELSKL